MLINLFPAFSLFGYPGLADPGLLTETTLDVQRLLTNHTKVHYAGVNGINLPETFNGLGVRNLIYILLKLLEFYKSFITKPTSPGIHIIFIEEPEVHLHPQMQEVFISKLNDLPNVFAKKFNNGIPWPVQFVVTTHSSHLANKATFESMRYFFSCSEAHGSNIHSTKIKDLKMGLGGPLKEDREFLHKYMTLTRCDLMFADKAILIEGITERLLLPKMIEKMEEEQPNGHRLTSQYISVMEVGGAYAHRFFRLLAFLELRTLIITDLDSTKLSEKGKYIKCKVSEGTGTSNGCIKEWFGDANIEPADLIKKSSDEKIQGICRLAYQVPEKKGAACGRSFEDAFILANQDLFKLTGEGEAWDKAEEFKKSDFAIEYAIEKIAWSVPRYTAEGLLWLAEGPCDPTIAQTTPLPGQTAGEETPPLEESHE